MIRLVESQGQDAVCFQKRTACKNGHGSDRPETRLGHKQWWHLLLLRNTHEGIWGNICKV